MEGRAAVVTMETFKSRAEWLKARTGRIGGSDASAVIGLNPYMDNVTLWEIKTGRRVQEDISEKDFVKYGTEAEEHLRALFALDYPQFTVDYVKNNMFLNSKYPHLHASLDGWLVDQDGRRGILEIKTTNILQSMQKEKWDHRIPSNYYAQVLLYLIVTEFDFAILKAQLKYDYNGEIFLTTKHYTIEREDVLEDMEYLLGETLKFSEYIKQDRRPPLVLNQI